MEKSSNVLMVSEDAKFLIQWKHTRHRRKNRFVLSLWYLQNIVKICVYHVLQFLLTINACLQFFFQKLLYIRIVFITQCGLKRHVTAFLILLAIQHKGISHDTFRVTVIRIDKPFADGCFLNFFFYLFGQCILQKTAVNATLNCKKAAMLCLMC